jgi:glyoxylase-like metal-dependent hydrolase (beta-lactamase superfamily II)
VRQFLPPLQPGSPERLRPGLRRVLAPNPSPLTGAGTNTYILGQGRVAVIDPGPADPAHLDALLAALDPGETVEWIIATHAHLDHTALAPALAERTGAPVYAFGDAFAGRNPAMADLGQIGGGEGLDLGFRPDLLLRDGESLVGPDWQLGVLHTPGHLGNHICLIWEDAVFSGDHVMGWSTTIVSPPDGDMSAYMASLARLGTVKAKVMFPGHGPAIPDAQGRLADLVAHRRMREAQILAALAGPPLPLSDLTRRVYSTITPSLLPAAERNVLAHLIDLKDSFRVDTATESDGSTHWWRTPTQ